MASKYDALARHLRQQPGSDCIMTFTEIERVLGEALPASARKWKAWWGNDNDGRSTHVEAIHGWHAAGWSVVESDLNRETVTFRRSPR